jgi:superfamily I DNA and/or RNA helicase
VHKGLQGYTVDARVGGDLQQDVRLLSKAQKRVKEAEIVFTTCAGAGLGVLRSLDFDIVIIDEASQITEPCALIPLVKGCQRAVIVGDQ